MCSEMSDPRASGNFGLTKNSSIPVTIDDLNEGLIVVSFSHRDNLFQGVLLQLNRERGIPAGISFPKDYCTGEGKKEGEKDPTQVPPLNQRHTYFQEIGGVCRTLRRVIKPPARYKNSRMSLRPVQRPVLCAKCGSRCDDKASPELTSNDSTVLEPTDKKRKRNGGNGGGPLKKMQPKSEKSSSALKSHIPIADNPILPIIDDPKDFSYESIGSHGILDNVWRRPLAKPVKYQNKNNGARSSTLEEFPVTGNGGGKVFFKPVPDASLSSAATSYPNDKTSSASSKNSNGARKFSNENPLNNLTISNLLVMKPLVPPPLFRVSRSPLISKGLSEVTPENKKAHNLKLCISKLTTAKNFQNNHCSTDSLYCSIDSLPSNTDADLSSGQDIRSNAISVEQNSDSELKVRVRGSKGRKRNSSVPLRFRDQSCATSNIVSSSNTKELPELRPLPKVKVSKKISEEFPGQSQYQINEYLVDGNTMPVESLENDNSFVLHGTGNSTCSTSASSSESTKEIQPNISIIKPIEPAKTPVIKITFGSSGNGMVVQIPPKTTHHQLENNDLDELESKAARKAMKKAKKEARKKHLILSTEPSTEVALSLPTLPLSTELNQELAKPVCDEFDHIIAEHTPFSAYEEPHEAFIIPKKRKKEKKKKKEKEHKENDLGSNSRSLGYAIKEPFSSSLAPINEESKSTTLNPLVIQICEPDCSAETSVTSVTSPGQNNQQAEAEQRICISLKRLATDDYVPWKSPRNDELDSVSESTDTVEPHDFPVNRVFNDAEKEGATVSLEFYYHEQSNRSYKNGDVVWGKSIGCPWWPGKIVDIVLREAEDIRAKVAWYKSTSQSFITFNDLCPFDEFFDTKYTKTRRRGSYQQAVRDAQMDVESVEREILTH